MHGPSSVNNLHDWQILVTFSWITLNILFALLWLTPRLANETSKHLIVNTMEMIFIAQAVTPSSRHSGLVQPTTHTSKKIPNNLQNDENCKFFEKCCVIIVINVKNSGNLKVVQIEIQFKNTTKNIFFNKSADTLTFRNPAKFKIKN